MRQIPPLPGAGDFEAEQKDAILRGVNRQREEVCDQVWKIASPEDLDDFERGKNDIYIHPKEIAEWHTADKKMKEELQPTIDAANVVVLEEIERKRTALVGTGGDAKTEEGDRLGKVLADSGFVETVGFGRSDTERQVLTEWCLSALRRMPEGADAFGYLSEERRNSLDVETLGGDIEAEMELLEEMIESAEGVGTLTHDRHVEFSKELDEFEAWAQKNITAGDIQGLKEVHSALYKLIDKVNYEAFGFTGISEPYELTDKVEAAAAHPVDALPVAADHVGADDVESERDGRSVAWTPDRDIFERGNGPESGNVGNFLDALEVMAAEVRAKIWEAPDEATIEMLRGQDEDFSLIIPKIADRAGIAWKNDISNEEKKVLREMVSGASRRIRSEADARTNILRLDLGRKVADFSKSIADAGDPGDLNGIGKDHVTDRGRTSRVFIDLVDGEDVILSEGNRQSKTTLGIMNDFVRDANRNLRYEREARMKRLRPRVKAETRNEYDDIRDFDTLYEALRGQGQIARRKMSGSDGASEPQSADDLIGEIDFAVGKIHEYTKPGSDLPPRTEFVLGAIFKGSLSRKIRNLLGDELVKVNRMNAKIAEELALHREALDAAEAAVDAALAPIFREAAGSCMGIIREQLAGAVPAADDQAVAGEIVEEALHGTLETMGVEDAKIRHMLIRRWMKTPEAKSIVHFESSGNTNL